MFGGKMNKKELSEDLYSIMFQFKLSDIQKESLSKAITIINKKGWMGLAMQKDGSTNTWLAR